MSKMFPRLLLGAPMSGSGKTLCTCAMLRLLQKKGLSPVGFKCGPDFIDPLFHEEVLHIPSRNLDLFLAGEEGVRSSLAKGSEDGSIGVIEGVMGLYDGMELSSVRGSAYDLGRATKTPVVLLLPAKGISRSAIALLKGFLSEDTEGLIRGFFLNRISDGFGRELKRTLEKELSLPVVGMLPELADGRLPGRHLGLFLPSEVPALSEIIDRAAAALEKTADLDVILSIAQEAGETGEVPPPAHCQKKRRIGIAKDEAFCFYYRENLELLERSGAELVPFSPIRDRALPEAEGLLLGGGYPELHLKELSENRGMLESIQRAVRGGMPVLAECGGFLYLMKTLTDQNGMRLPLAGVLHGEAFPAKGLSRFGYVEVTARENTPYLKEGESIRAHEFHYFDTTENGNACLIKKPLKDRSWEGVHSIGKVFAGFPHLYYPSMPAFARRFMEG